MRLPHAGHSFLLLGFVWIVYFLLVSVMQKFPQTVPNQLMIMFIFQAGVIFLPTLIYTQALQFDPRLTFPLQSLPFWKLLVGLVITLASIILLIQINIILRPIFKPYLMEAMQKEQQLIRMAKYNFYLLLIMVGLLPAICEEILFRGFILSGLRRTFGDLGAILLSSVFFGVMHLFLPQAVLTSFLGIILGMLLVLTGSLIVPILMHFINNSLCLGLILWGRRLTFIQENSHVPLWLLMPAGIVFILGVVVLVKTYKGINKT